MKIRMTMTLIAEVEVSDLNYDDSSFEAIKKIELENMKEFPDMMIDIANEAKYDVELIEE